MALRTNNSYGTITVSDDVIASLAGHLATECYGVVEMVPFGFPIRSQTYSNATAKAAA